MNSFGFIGCGNMGGALAQAVACTDRHIALADRSQENVMRVSKETNAPIYTNAEIAQNSSAIVLGVKPQVLPSVLEEIAPILAERHDRYTVITMAAGVKIETVAAVLGQEVPIIRIMPNMPASVGEGMIVYSVSETVTAAEKEAFETAFSAAGEICEISETLMDAASAVSGCGPAFVYLFIEALADGGVRCGLPRELALKLAEKTVGGSAEAALVSGKHPGALKDAVCSPAGSTIEGVEVLEKGAFRGTVAEAVAASFRRTKELG